MKAPTKWGVDENYKIRLINHKNHATIKNNRNGHPKKGV